MGNLCCANQDLVLRPLLPQIPDQFASKRINTSAFKFVKFLGFGSFGRVLLVQKIDTNQLYAMKIINKGKLTAQTNKIHALTERQVLAQVISPFVVKLHYAFQTSDRLYLVLDYMEGGDLFSIKQLHGRLPVSWVQFYTAEVLCAIEDLHSYEIIYRDLKPENILLGHDGHIKLADFNLAKFSTMRTKTMCGTPEYISPEVILRMAHNKAIDFWGLGVLIYELIEGTTPFSGNDSKELFNMILQGRYCFSQRFSDEAIDLITHLLEPDPKRRLQSVNILKQHPFYSGVQWTAIRERKLTPPISPGYTAAVSVESSSLNSPVPNWNSSQKKANLFEKFTYTESFSQQFQ